MEPPLDALLSDDPDARQQAIESVRQGRHPSAIHRLIEIVSETRESRENRTAAAAALGAIGSDEAVQSLHSLIEAEDEELRGLAAIGLGEWKTADSVLLLIDALADRINTVRNLAERSLLSMTTLFGEAAIQKLLALLTHPAPLTRSPAARLLGQIRDQRALKPLLEMLEHDDQWLARMWAAKALGDLGKQDVFDALAHAMQHDAKNRVRAAAAEAIGKLRAPESEAMLKRALKDEDGGVRKIAEESLAALRQAKFER